MIRQWIENWKAKRAVEARRRLKKQKLEQFGWEIKCDQCHKYHHTDNAGHVFAESDQLWHVVCQCGKKSQFYVGAPVLLPAGESTLKVISGTFYTLHEFKNPVYSISTPLTGEQCLEISCPIIKGYMRVYYDYATDAVIGHSVYEMYDSISYDSIDLPFLKTEFVSSNGAKILETIKQYYTPSLEEEGNWI